MKDRFLTIPIVIVWCLLLVFAPARDFERELWLARASGTAAIVTLLITLAARPIGLERHRRSLGLVAATFAAVHAGHTILSPLVADLTLLIYEPQLRSGATALVILLFLAATSFPKVLNVKAWKALHRTIYVALGFSILHLVQSPFASRTAVLGFSAIAIGLMLARLNSRLRRPRSRR